MHHQWAKRSCFDCQKYLYNPDGEVTLRAGQKVERGGNDRPPCWKCPKIPEGSPPDPSSAIELSYKNRKAYEHWLEARAVGFKDNEKDDDIVRRNASILHNIYEQLSQQKNSEIVATALSAGLSGGGGKPSNSVRTNLV